VYIPPLHPPCYGLPFQWDLAPDSNIQVSLPWLRTLHGKLDILPYTFNILDGQAHACSSDCSCFIVDTGDSCPTCAAVGPAIDELGKSIPLYQPRTRRSLKNVLQLSQTIDERSKELDQWKLKVRIPFSYDISAANRCLSCSMMPAQSGISSVPSTVTRHFSWRYPNRCSMASTNSSDSNQERYWHQHHRQTD
jgi:hypothetical protein